MPFRSRDTSELACSWKHTDRILTMVNDRMKASIPCYDRGPDTCNLGPGFRKEPGWTISGIWILLAMIVVGLSPGLRRLAAMNVSKRLSLLPPTMWSFSPVMPGCFPSQKSIRRLTISWRGSAILNRGVRNTGSIVPRCSSMRQGRRCDLLLQSDFPIAPGHAVSYFNCANALFPGKI